MSSSKIRIVAICDADDLVADVDVPPAIAERFPVDRDPSRAHNREAGHVASTFIYADAPGDIQQMVDDASDDPSVVDYGRIREYIETGG